jgi:hypothetical protein
LIAAITTLAVFKSMDRFGAGVITATADWATAQHLTAEPPPESEMQLGTRSVAVEVIPVAYKRMEHCGVGDTTCLALLETTQISTESHLCVSAQQSGQWSALDFTPHVLPN